MEVWEVDGRCHEVGGAGDLISPSVWFSQIAPARIWTIM